MKTVKTKTCCGTLLWLMSSRFSRWEWKSEEWTMDTPRRSSTMKPTVQSSGRRIFADVCSNWEPLKWKPSDFHHHWGRFRRPALLGGV